MTSRRFAWIALLTLGASASAQGVNVSGTWVRVDSSATSVATTGDAAFRVGDMGSGWGTPLTITQGADSLIVAYDFFSAYDLQPPVRLAYAMNGTESRNSVMIGHATVSQRGRVAVRDSAVVITTVFEAPPEVKARGGVEMRQVLRLVSPTQLAVETTRPGVGGAPAIARTIYTRR